MTETIPRLPEDLRGAAIGFVGLGKMGVPMAANLCAAGFLLRVQDLDADAVARFTAAHEAEAATPETLGEADILLLMLPNGAVVRDVLLAAPPGATPLADRMRAGAVVIDMKPRARRRVPAISGRRWPGAASPWSTRRSAAGCRAPRPASSRSWRAATPASWPGWRRSGACSDRASPMWAISAPATR